MITKQFKNQFKLLATAVTIFIFTLLIILPQQAAANVVANTPNSNSSFLFTAEADAALLSNRASSNLGLFPQLTTDAAPEMYSLLRFNVAGLSSTVNNATLRLFVQSDSTLGVDILAVDDNSWAETAVTYSTAPGNGNLLNSSGSLTAGSWVEIDVTSYITGEGLFSLAVTSNDTNRLTFSSRESNNPPELIVNLNPTPTATPDPSATATPIPTPTPEPGSGGIIYLSLADDGTVNDLNYADEDVLAFDYALSTWSMVIDGSDLGLGANDIDALFWWHGDGSFYISLERAQILGSLGMVDDAEIIRFIPTSLGENTAGSFEKFIDGTDIGLLSGGEDIDAFGITADSHAVVSTLGNFSVDFSGAGEDLILLDNAIYGDPTFGNWLPYFDGSDVELTDSSEDIDALDIYNSFISFSTSGDSTVNGVSGDGATIFSCLLSTNGEDTVCSYFFVLWDGTANGLNGANIDALTIDPED